MPELTIVMNVEQDGFEAMRGIDPDDIIHLNDEAGFAVGALEGGMVSGAASVALCFKLPDGKVVLAETSLKLFGAAADALRARYGGA